MTARTGMTGLILRVRGMVSAGTADYTLGTANYWDDNHVQEVLDMHRVDVYREKLVSMPTHASAGSLTYTEYRSRFPFWESGTAVFTLEDSTGANIGTASFTADYERGIITFGADTGGSTYYVSGRVYDANSAASDIWRQKAGHFSEHYTFSTDGHSLKRGEIIANCLKMADYYSGLKASEVITLGN